MAWELMDGLPLADLQLLVERWNLKKKIVTPKADNPRLYYHRLYSTTLRCDIFGGILGASTTLYSM